jgi:hypothetical protein
MSDSLPVRVEEKQLGVQRTGQANGGCPKDRRVRNSDLVNIHIIELEPTLDARKISRVTDRDLARNGSPGISDVARSFDPSRGQGWQAKTS